MEAKTIITVIIVLAVLSGLKVIARVFPMVVEIVTFQFWFNKRVNDFGKEEMKKSSTPSKRDNFYKSGRFLVYKH